MVDMARRRKEKEKKMKGAAMKWKGKKGERSLIAIRFPNNPFY